MSISPFRSLARSFALCLALTAVGCGGATATRPHVNGTPTTASPTAGEQRLVVVGDFDLAADRLEQDPVADAAEAIYRGDLAAARAALEALVARTPAGWTPVTRTERGLAIAAWSFVEITMHVADHAGDSSIREVAWVAPSYSRAHALLAYLAVEAGELDHAAELLDAGLALEQHPDLLTERGLVAAQQKQPGRALELYTQASEAAHATDAQRARAWRGRGGSLVNLGRLDDAEAAFRTSLDLEPASKLALSELEYIRQLRAGTVTPNDGTIIRSQTN